VDAGGAQLTEAEVDAMVANNGYALAGDLALVATTGDFADLVNAPVDQDTLAGLGCADGQVARYDEAATAWACADALDTDTLAMLGCLDGQVAKWDGAALVWGCADDVDTDTNTQLTEAEVDAFVANNGYAMDGHDHDADYAAIGHNHDADYAAIGHDHDAAYVNEGQANSVTSGMIVNGTVGAADIDAAQVQRRVDGTCAAGSSIRIVNADGTVTCQADSNTTYTAGAGLSLSGTTFSISTGGITSAMIADGTIQGADINPGTTLTAGNFQYQSPQTRYSMIAGGQCQFNNGAPTDNRPFFCQLGSNRTAVWHVDLPHGATLLGMRTYFWSAGGTITCQLMRGIEVSGVQLATNTTTLNGWWHWSTEAALNHVVDTANNAYAISCSSNTASVDQPVGVIRLRYTVTQPY
jgi:hypothetical protein